MVMMMMMMLVAVVVVVVVVVGVVLSMMLLLGDGDKIRLMPATFVPIQNAFGFPVLRARQLLDSLVLPPRPLYYRHHRQTRPASLGPCSGEALLRRGVWEWCKGRDRSCIQYSNNAAKTSTQSLRFAGDFGAQGILAGREMQCLCRCLPGDERRSINRASSRSRRRGPRRCFGGNRQILATQRHIPRRLALLSQYLSQNTGLSSCSSTITEGPPEN